MSLGTVYMTPDGMRRAQASLERKCSEYDAICRERTIAHELSGDGWHDNPHFNRLQQLEADKSREIASLKTIMGSARLFVINAKSRPTDAVRLGSIVRIQTTQHCTGFVQNSIWEIVGYDETNAVEGKLAYNSPLGAALIGREEGDVSTVSLVGIKTDILVDSFLENHP